MKQPDTFFKGLEVYVKLQVALDVPTIDEALKVLEETKDYVDIAEIGTVMVYCGFSAITVIKNTYPQLEILADLKIYDGAAEMAEAAIKAGADYVTILGATNDVTIREAIRVTRDMGKKSVVDMIAVRNIAERIKEVDGMGADFINVHIACDAQTEKNTPFEQLSIARIVAKHSGICVAGGVRADTIINAMPYHPDIITSGAGIYAQKDRRAAAKKMKEIILANGK